MWPHTIQTSRLVLRPWRDDDAEALFRWASDPEVGPAAGWPAHASVEESRAVIGGVLDMPESYALCERDAQAAEGPVGAVALKIGAVAADALALGSDEAELGYWLARPLWGRGYMTEAVRALLDHGFADLGLAAVWGLHYECNRRSARVMGACGLAYVRTLDAQRHPVTGEPVREDVRRITRDEWRRSRAQAAARVGLS